MSNTLSGLTPAQTFQGLIKVGNNTNLDGTLKVLSDGSGNDLPMEVSTTGVNFTGTLTQNGQPITTTPSGGAGSIQFSDGSAFASDSNLFWDNTNKRLGIGESTPTARVQIKGSGNTSLTTSLLIKNSDGDELLRVLDNALNQTVRMSTALIGQINIVSNNVINSANIRLVPTTGGIAINKDYSFSSANTLVHIKGSGSTSATTSLLVQNSSGANLIRVRDDGNILCEGGGGISSVGIIGTAYGLFGGASYEPSASLVCGGTTTGFLPPRMTTTQKNAISTPASGLQVYDTTLNQMSYYNGSSWINF